MVEFAELCAKTNFSLLEGASRPEEMLQAAHEFGLYAIAVADSRGLYGSVRAHEAARKLGQRYIVGAELLLCGERKREKKPKAPSKAVLLARNKNGYTNLCRLLTQAHADLPREEARLSLAELADHARDIFLILGVPAEEEMREGELSRDATFAIAPALKDLMGDRAFIATSRLM